MKISKRDLTVAAITFCATAALAATGIQLEKMESSAFEWKDMAVRKTRTGEVRTVFRSPTATLEELECHITTLNPGETPHPPHKHAAEEIIIIREGTVESLVNGVTKTIGPGSVIFQASQQMHAIRNVGDVPATYHVFSWRTTATEGKK
ncbi:MAG: cupin [Cytophagaceae bacterium SCN 52-12]|nr:MAG: cupin [Cytophagaceae bacterium SCN 52-12]